MGGVLHHHHHPPTPCHSPDLALPLTLSPPHCCFVSPILVLVSRSHHLAPCLHPTSSCSQWWLGVLWSCSRHSGGGPPLPLIAVPSPSSLCGGRSALLLVPSSSLSSSPSPSLSPFHPVSSCSHAWFGVLVVLVVPSSSRLPPLGHHRG